MKTSPLQTTPLWRPEELGRAIPDSPHAASACLPTWQDVIGYETKEDRVMSALQCGYPRFVIHPQVEKLFKQCLDEFGYDGEFCMVYPSEPSAKRACEFVEETSRDVGRIQPLDCGAFAVFWTECAYDSAKAYWQHGGEGVSSRRAEAILAGKEKGRAQPAVEEVRERVAECYNVEEELVFLFPSGMAAIWAAIRAVQELNPGLPSVQYGFPYVDTLKIQQKVGPGVSFLPKGGADIDGLEKLLKKGPISGLFCETPSNPLLITPDLIALKKIGEKEPFPVITDDTLGACENLNVLPHSDVVAVSLTKYFSGTGDVLGGALIVSPYSRWAPFFHDFFQREKNQLLWQGDMAALAKNSEDLLERVILTNQNAEQLCDYLNQHPKVEKVFYPKFTEPKLYNQLKSIGGGYGGLFSFILKDQEKAPQFFDNLQVSKGPNLGTIFSLSCPFTILAHYDELDFATECGLSQYLIRFSTGLEPLNELISRFNAAFEAMEQ